ncbi:hypothetical protein PDESU_01850 [Pontiella desulfatans]|uniref:Asl1-like glycosyl hydrolase catalytic domain-containing protein n=1 Tax=Pontiella desulfatans TaxID=2750659 RepID=A0A6C2U0P4_PONDE|nr:hypothetical protein [Pontiella desulfatans]VGO13294.1 hypothetical protein PDESU_01850 [Pontiella desulfatans]
MPLTTNDTKESGGLFGLACPGGRTGFFSLKRPSAVLLALLLMPWGLKVEAKQPRMLLGANVNEHGVALDPELLELSRTKVCRTFFPATPFILGKRDLKTDADLLAVKRAGKAGQQIILCLKWNFEKARWRVPEPDSPRERQCFAWADALIRELDGYVVALETVNEVTVDTLPEDMLPGADGEIPMPRFLQRLVAHLSEQGHAGANAKPLPLFSGGFTRLEQRRMQSNPGVQALLDWIETDDRVAGANFHIHMPEFEGFENYLKFIRSRVTDKPYIVTEFSMVWKYKENLDGKSHDGLTVREYINQAIQKPVPEKEWNAFLESQAWYDPQFLSSACKVMEDYGVMLATFAFQQGSSGGRKLEPDDTPWIINPIFATRTAAARGRAAVSEGFMRDYLDWQRR